jgi:VanZ family protein
MIDRTKSIPAYELRLQPLWLGMGCSLVIAIMYLSLARNPSAVAILKVSDKASHFFAYGVTMFWFSLVFGRSWIRFAIATALLIMGISLEYIQGMSGYRAFEFADMAANAAGIVSALAASKTPLSKSLTIFEKYLLRVIHGQVNG